VHNNLSINDADTKRIPLSPEDRKNKKERGVRYGTERNSNQTRYDAGGNIIQRHLGLLKHQWPSSR